MAPTIDIYQFDYIVSQFDGNNNDKDDIAALPIAAALTNAKDLQQKSVFFYDDNISESNINEQVQHMRAGAAFADKLGIETVDYQADLSKANNRLVNIFNTGKKVLSLEGGPIETTYLALEQTSPENLKNITLVSHSNWNEEHDEGSRPGGGKPRTWEDIKKDFPEVNLIQIADQNGVWLGSNYDGSTGFQNDDWNWLDSTTNPVLKEARELMKNAGSKINDPSDFGMHFYAFTGNETGEPNDAKAFFDTYPPKYASKVDDVYQVQNDRLIIEAEDLNLDTYVLEDYSALDPGVSVDALGISLNNASAFTGTASFSASTHGLEGTYDFQLSYFDENDGEAKLQVLVNNDVKGDLLLNEATNNHEPTEDTRREYVIEDLFIQSTDTITIRGTADDGDFARVDFLSFSDSPIASPDVPTS